MPKLKNDRHEAVVRHYVADCNFNQLKAYLSAGYAESHAKTAACHLFARPDIQQRISELMQDTVKKSELKAEEVLEEVRRLAFSNIGDYVEFGPEGVILKDSSAIPHEALACVREVRKSAQGTIVGLHSKERSLELLMRYLGLLIEKHDVTVTRKAAQGYLQSVFGRIFELVKDDHLREEIVKVFAGAAQDGEE